jgi:hypothetical protein
MPLLLALVLALVHAALLPLLTAHLAWVLLRAHCRGGCSATLAMHRGVLLRLLLLATAAAAAAAAVGGCGCGGVGSSQWLQLHCCAVMAGEPKVCGAAGVEPAAPVRGIVQQHCMVHGTAAAAAAAQTDQVM